MDETRKGTTNMSQADIDKKERDEMIRLCKERDKTSTMKKIITQKEMDLRIKMNLPCDNFILLKDAMRPKPNKLAKGNDPEHISKIIPRVLNKIHAIKK